MANKKYKTEDVIAVGYKEIYNYGYKKTSDINIRPESTTKYQVLDMLDNGPAIKASAEDVADFMKWVNSKDPITDYEYKAKTACTSESCTAKDFSYILSFISVYFKEIERKAEQEKRAAEAAVSEYVGEVGQKVYFKVADYRVLYWKEPYAYSSDSVGVYRIIDTDGHIIIWATANEWICKDAEIKGTVKKHQEYKGEKQTVITRGTILYSPEKEKEEDEMAKYEEEDSFGPSLNGFYDYID